MHALAAWRGAQLVGLAPLMTTADDTLTFMGVPLNDENAFLLDATDAVSIASAILNRIAKVRRFARIAIAPGELLSLLLSGQDRGLPSDWRMRTLAIEPAARLSLPPRWDVYVDALPTPRSKRFRYILRRAERELNLGFSVSVAPHLAAGDADRLLDLREASMSLRGLWSGCLPEAKGEPFGSFIHRLCRQPRGRSSETYLARLTREGTVVAIGLYLRFHDDLMKYCHGWAPELRHFSPGTILDLKMISWAIDAGCRRFDLGRGDEPYKERFSASPVLLTSSVLEHVGL
jgi:CelD/BcsL family acetyltransferase involved in cellulose biosynthesis